MSDKPNHKFFFKASVIAKKAKEESEYHRERVEFWKGERIKMAVIVQKTAKVKVDWEEADERARRSGWHRDSIFIVYEDQKAYERFRLADSKVVKHQDTYEKHATVAELYGSQEDREYELTLSEVNDFRLGGEPRED